MQSEGYVQGFQIDEEHSLHIYRGSLVEVEADALVSSDDNYLSAGGGVSHALAAAAGFDVARERQQIVRERRPALGEVVRTSGGGLPCRYLYHAITIDDDRGAYMDEAALRSLIANLLRQATADGVKSIGMPALGTGAAFFDLARASEIMIDELLVRLIETPIRRVVLALVGSEAEHLFHERLVRSQAKRLAALELRRRETASTPRPARPEPPSPPGPPGQVIEQFPKLVDEERLSATPPDRPRLVAGLAQLILKYADAEDIERELLSSPACRSFRGALKQRLMEFLYLAEDNLRLALGPALFKNKDLRQMLADLGEDSELPRDQDQLIVAILRALCFNTLTPPLGIGEYIARLERLLADLRVTSDERNLAVAAVEAGKILELALKDLLRMYGYVFFGAEFETELVTRHVVAQRRDGNHVARLTIGQALEALQQLNALVHRDSALRAKWRDLGRPTDELLPLRVAPEAAARGVEGVQVLRSIIAARNESAHTGGSEGMAGLDEMVERIQRLHAFFCDWQAMGLYPDVLRYEGTYENRSGERFVYFLDEKGCERKVRTDETIDARRHYYCFASNNPIHLHPTLIPKLH
jgi:O-acetyl-ADP-ribose deacetylase (regulator of RNase III)